LIDFGDKAIDDDGDRRGARMPPAVVGTAEFDFTLQSLHPGIDPLLAVRFTM
jgi:hypothetical protein